MIPAACASARPSHAWSTNDTASAGASLPRRRMRSASVSPSSSSMTMNGSPDASLPKSNTFAMCSPVSPAMSPPLALETRDHPRALGHPLAKKLDRDHPVELAVARRHDDPHPPRGEDPYDEVLVRDDVPGTRRQPVHGTVTRRHFGEAIPSARRPGRSPPPDFSAAPGPRWHARPSHKTPRSRHSLVARCSLRGVP
jgi:hypothetical protein